MNEMSMLEAALSYTEKGYLVFPCKARSKKPATKNGFYDATTDEAQIREWWGDDPERNIGIRTGRESNLVVLDLDKDGKKNGVKTAKERGWHLSDTAAVRTREGRYQLYFKYPAGVERLPSKIALAPGLDFKADGGYVVAPPSVHPDTGKPYTWHVHSDKVEIAECPGWLLKALRQPSERFTTPVEETIEEGARNNTLFSRARSLFKQGYNETEVFSLLHALNRNRCKPPIEDDELEAIVESAAKYSRGALHVDNSPTFQPGEAGVLMSEVEAEEVRWLWEKRIPLGKLTLLEGDPDYGKSVITMDLAARVTTGRAFPNGDVDYVGNLEHLDSFEDVGGVVILNAEDAPADTIRPRLDAAGADVAKVLALPPIKDDESIFSIPGDIPFVERAIESVDAKLVIVDPLSAFMKGDANKDQDVRKALTPFSKMAERTGAAVVVVRHFNKNIDAKALYRGGGSIGIIGAARSALAVAPHPDDEELRVLVPQKGNLSKKAPTLAYSIVSAQNGAPCIEWKGCVNLNADELLNVEKGEEARAKVWLADKLKHGPAPASAIEEAARAVDISDSTLNRAKKKLGVKSKKDGPSSSWRWHLEDSQDTQGVHPTQHSQEFLMREALGEMDAEPCCPTEEEEREASQMWMEVLEREERDTE